MFAQQNLHCFFENPWSCGFGEVMISASKYIGGHSDMTGGALVVGNQDLAQRRRGWRKWRGILWDLEEFLGGFGMIWGSGLNWVNFDEFWLLGE
jgi:threonine aldolase